MKKKKSFSFIFGIGIIILAFLGMASKPKAHIASKVEIVRLKNNHYQLLVNKKPYIVRGVCYSPIPIGSSYDYDFWSDANQPWKTDGKMMKRIGINTVRFYSSGNDPIAVRKVISELYSLYGIRTIMGNWLGFWNYPAPFYSDPNFRNNIKREVLRMVREYKDEPGILFWVLGNENNYSFSGRVNPWPCPEAEKLTDPREQIEVRARIYYSFINELAREIHRLDPNHPVVMGNGELMYLDIAKQYCPDIDIIGSVIYRGKTFGNIFRGLRNTFDKPLLLIEFGCDAYNAYTKKEDQENQSVFIISQWREIYKNIAGGPGEGNCLGGTIFEWNDEWWKHNDYDSKGWIQHDTESNWSNGAYYFDIKVEGNKNMNEEWFGIVGLSPELQGGLNKRLPRKIYYMLGEFWKRPQRFITNAKESNRRK